MCVLKKRYLHLYEIYGYTAVPLNVRGMEWDPLPEDRMPHGRGIRAYMDVFTACLRQRVPIHLSD